MKFRLGQDRSAIILSSLTHVHVLPFFLIFYGYKGVSVQIELQQLPVVFLQIFVEFWIFLGQLRKFDKMSNTLVYVLP